MPPLYPLWECPSKAISQLMSTLDQVSFQPAGRRVRPSSVCHGVTHLKNAVPLPFLCFLHRLAALPLVPSHVSCLVGYLQHVGVSHGCPTQLSKEACYKLGYREVFLQRFRSREGQWGTVTHFPVTHFPLSHDQACLRFMCHLYGSIMYLASWP